MKEPLRRQGALALWLVTFLLAYGHPIRGTEPVPPVPRPDLGSLTAPARTNVESTQSDLQRAIDGGNTPDEQLASSFVFLGQLFRAYELLAPAEESFSAAHQLQPRNGAWLYLRGLTRADQERADEAIDDLRASLSLEGDPTAARLALGEMLLSANRPGEARREFESVLSPESQNAAAEYGLGRAELAEKEYAAAIDHLEMALSLQPSASVVHGFLERAYQGLGQPERASEHRGKHGSGTFPVADPLNAAILRIRTVTDFEVLQEMANSPSLDEPKFLDLALGNVSSMPGAIDRLDSLVRETQALGEPVAAGRIRYARAALLLQAGREDEAREDLATAIQLAPNLIDARLQLGNGLARSGRFEDAVLEYQRLLLLSPDHPQALLKRAAAQANLGNLADARGDLEHALKVAEDNETTSEALTLIARLDLTQGNLEEAEKRFRAAVASDPTSVSAASRLASLLGRLGQYREAAERFRDVIGLEPRNGNARLSEAVALILVEDYAGARERLEEGVVEVPEDLGLRQKLALLLAACPDRDQRDGPRAVELAKQIFAKRPGEESVEALAMAYAEAGDFAQATLWQRRLLSAGAASGDDGQRQVWQRNLVQYENGLSCCAVNPEP